MLVVLLISSFFLLAQEDSLFGLLSSEYNLDRMIEQQDYYGIILEIESSKKLYNDYQPDILLGLIKAYSYTGSYYKMYTLYKYLSKEYTIAFFF